VSAAAGQLAHAVDDLCGIRHLASGGAFASELFGRGTHFCKCDWEIVTKGDPAGPKEVTVSPNCD